MTGIQAVRRARPVSGGGGWLAALLALSGCAGMAIHAAGNTIDRTGDGDNDHAASAVFDGGAVPVQRGTRAGERPVPLYRNARAANAQPVFAAGTALAEVVAEGGVVTLTDANGGRQVATSVAELLRP